MKTQLNVAVYDGNERMGKTKYISVDINRVFKIGKIKVFLHREINCASKMLGSRWVVSEYYSGYRISNDRIIKDTINKAKNRIFLKGYECTNEKINEMVKKYGAANT